MARSFDWRSDPIVQIENDVENVVPLCALWLAELPASTAADSAEKFTEWNDQLDRAVDRFSDAGKSLFAPMNIETPEHVTDACKAAASALKALAGKASDITAPATPENIIALSAFLRLTVRPAIQDALDGLRGTFITAIVQRQVVQKTQANQAICQVRDISKKIFFISINASVEAARVGDAGKGFSMISQEIRSLSQTAKAAVDDLSSATD